MKGKHKHDNKNYINIINNKNYNTRRKNATTRTENETSSFPQWF